MNLCIICKQPVEASLVKENFPELFAQADALGINSLTEQQQIVVEFKCCSKECYGGMELIYNCIEGGVL